jgi:hypothetical protein
MEHTRLSYQTLCTSSSSELEALLLEGLTPTLEDLSGWEFRGFNVSPAAELIRSRKFKKGFQPDPRDGAGLLGYNVKVRQNGILNPWIPVLEQGEPVRHAPFAVYPVRLAERDNLYPRALLLNYAAAPGRPLVDPSILLRDYLVQVYPDDQDLYLGKAYGAIGPLRVLGGYFVLGRENKVL